MKLLGVDVGCLHYWREVLGLSHGEKLLLGFECAVVPAVMVGR